MSLSNKSILVSLFFWGGGGGAALKGWEGGCAAHLGEKQEETTLKVRRDKSSISLYLTFLFFFLFSSRELQTPSSDFMIR